jgi:predicted alpha-1,6-mannanase (GH76 family)
MKINIRLMLIIVGVVLSATGCSSKCATKSQTVSAEIPSGINWEQTAEDMSQALIKHFWGASFDGYPDRYYFNYGSNLSNMTTKHYWPQAHAMDVIVDAYLRTSSQKYLNLYPLWWEGAPKFNFAGRKEDPWWNVFVDDMEWISLAQIRMYESTNNIKYLSKAQQMYDDWIWSIVRLVLCLTI